MVLKKSLFKSQRAKTNLRFLPILHQFFFSTLLLVSGLFSPSVSAQSVFVKPKAAVAGYTLAVEIKNAMDLKFMEQNLSAFSQVQRLRVDADIDIGEVCEVIGKLDQLEEVILQKYLGVLGDDDLVKLEWLQNLMLYIPDGKENAQLLNANWNLMQGVTLVFQNIPDDYHFLSTWKLCKRFNLVGPYDLNTCKIAIAEVQKNMPQLQEFGISLDRVNHLTVDVKKMGQLKRLNIIDNISWATDNNVWDYGDVTLKLGFNDPATKRFRAIDLHYLSANPELMASEKEYLQKMFPDVAAPKEEALWMDFEEEKKFDFAQRIALKPITSRSGFPKPITKPLLPQYQDGWYEFSASTSIDQMFSVEGKAVILMPHDALLSANGKPFSGSYTFRVKWMDNTLRQIAFGVPLTRDSMGKKFPLNATLVADLQCFSGKEELKLNPNAKIELRFVGDPLPLARMYAYDTTKGGKWENYYEYDYKFDDDKMMRIDFTEFYMGLKTGTMAQTLDLVEMEDRISMQGFNYLLAPDEVKSVIIKYHEFAVKKNGSKPTGDKDFILRRGAAIVGIRKHPSKVNPENGVFEFNIYDKTEYLFPDLKPLSNYPFALKTSMERKLVMQDFFRVQKFWDFYFFKSGNQWFLQLRGNDGLWQLELYQPKDRYRSNPRLAKLEQMKFDKLMSKAVMQQNQRLRIGNVVVQEEWNTQVAASKNAALDVAAPPAGTVRNSFRVRSLGRFAFAQPVALDTGMNLTLIMADAGKAPLDARRVAIVLKNPNRILWLGAQAQYDIELNLNNLSGVLVETFDGRIFGMSGEEFRKTPELQNNFLFYLPLTLLEEKQLDNQALTELLYGKKALSQLKKAMSEAANGGGAAGSKKPVNTSKSSSAPSKTGAAPKKSSTPVKSSSKSKSSATLHKTGVAPK